MNSLPVTSARGHLLVRCLQASCNCLLVNQQAQWAPVTYWWANLTDPEAKWLGMMFRTPSPHRDVAEVHCGKEAVTNSRSTKQKAVPSCCWGHWLPKALCLCYTCTMNTPPSLQAFRHCIRLPNRGTSSKKARIYSAWQGKTSTSLSNTRNLSANMQRRPIQKEIHATEKRTGPQDGCFCTRLFGHIHAY